jgi:hypothetical protein
MGINTQSLFVASGGIASHQPLTGTLFRVDLTSGRVVAQAATVGLPFAAAASRTKVWVGGIASPGARTTGANQIVQVDSRTLKVEKTFRVLTPLGIARDRDETFFLSGGPDGADAIVMGVTPSGLKRLTKLAVMLTMQGSPIVYCADHLYVAAQLDMKHDTVFDLTNSGHERRRWRRSQTGYAYLACDLSRVFATTTSGEVFELGAASRPEVIGRSASPTSGLVVASGRVWTMGYLGWNHKTSTGKFRLIGYKITESGAREPPLAYTLTSRYGPPAILVGTGNELVVGVGTDFTALVVREHK